MKLKGSSGLAQLVLDLRKREKKKLKKKKKEKKKKKKKKPDDHRLTPVAPAWDNRGETTIE